MTQQQRYMDCPDNQQIVEDMENLYRGVIQSIPEEEMKNVKVEITADQLCCICELLMATLVTYEGYGEDVDCLDSVYEAVH